ncbi:uncharacterized protein LOC129769121 [Toxorhynchites rutilus septentrionalis]|uniref:uncharacterized protein LOC129769121 n=1 Tax=Toxorhynchites rutilus septentrionalis TaxID=329112 RepID=UPI00247AAFB1|nr:uncharacterized protein LOC129769121 [Toxorhynchites rutilus septentrionalis]
MRLIWIVLGVGLSVVLGSQVDEYCNRGFREVLTASNCDYYAYGPQTLMTSYCHWDEQPYYGITSKFCCSGVCAYCFKKFTNKTNEEADLIPAIDNEKGNGNGERNSDENDIATVPNVSKDDYTDNLEPMDKSLDELLATKMKRMMQKS